MRLYNLPMATIKSNDMRIWLVDDDVNGWSGWREVCDLVFGGNCVTNHSRAFAKCSARRTPSHYICVTMK